MFFKTLTSFFSKSFTLFFEIANINLFYYTTFFVFGNYILLHKICFVKNIKKVMCNPVRDILKKISHGWGELQSPSTPLRRKNFQKSKLCLIFNFIYVTIFV